jgi:transposase
MSMHPQEPPSVPEETCHVARAAFPKGTLCLRIADELGAIYNDSQFAPLFPRRGKPAEAPGRLALATVLQFVEGLSDRQTADAVRGRIDWKYALGLSLIDPGFDRSVLSEFRSRLIEGGAERLLLDTLLQRLRDQGLVKANLITHHPQPRVPCQAPVNPRFEHVVHALGRWLPVETRAGIEATDKANSLRKAPTH